MQLKGPRPIDDLTECIHCDLVCFLVTHPLGLLEDIYPKSMIANVAANLDACAFLVQPRLRLSAVRLLVHRGDQAADREAEVLQGGRIGD